MKYLVTGGAGFIGSHFIEYMMKQHPGDKFICLDALTYAGSTDYLKAVWDDACFLFIKGDIRDRKAVYDLFEQHRPDIVVNFAAESHVDRSIVSPGLFIETNIMGTEILMDACRKYGIQRFHQISTDEVYGDLPLSYTGKGFTEETPLNPHSPYSASKAGADLLVLAYARTYGLPVSITRCSNNYGSRQYPEKLIPLVVKMACKNEPLPIYGDGKNVRDWLYVEDHCEAIDKVLQYKTNKPVVFNIGGHNERSNLEVVKAILKELGKPEGLIQFVKDRPGHDRKYAMDYSKIEKELGWHPKTKWEEGLRKTISALMK